MRAWPSLLAGLMFAVPAFGTDSPAPLKIVGTIPLPNIDGRIDHFSIDLQHQIVFVAARKTVYFHDLGHELDVSIGNPKVSGNLEVTVLVVFRLERP